MTLLPRINIGQVSNDGQGDRPRVVGEKINEAFETLEGLVDPSPAIAAANQAAGSAQSAAESLEAIGNSLAAGEAAAAAAELSAQAAATSESNAATSETNAATSAGNAATSESNAATSEGNAATSESNAAASAGTATTQAGIATTQAGIATTQAGNAATSAGNAATSESNAAASEAGAAAEAARLQGTSATSIAIGAGSNGFTTQAGKAFDVGTFVLIRSDANPSVDWMFGQVTAYSGTSLTVNVTAIGGTGTHTDWTIYGRAGAQGAPAAGTGDFVGLASSTTGNIVTYGDTTGKQAGDGGATVAAIEASATNIAARIHAASSKSTPVDADEIPLSDSAASWALKKLTWANVKVTLNAVYDWATVANAAAGKSTPVDADELSIVDSAAGNVIKKLTWANLKATLNAIYDWATVVNGASGKTTPVGGDSIGIIDSAASNVLKKVTFTNLLAAFKASASAIWAGTSDALWITAKNIADSLAFVTLTSGTTIATDCSLGSNFFVTLAHNATFSAPTNAKDGYTYTWLIQQDGTGSRTGTWNSAFEFTSTPTLSTTAGKRDLVTAVYHAASGKFIAGFRKAS